MKDVFTVKEKIMNIDHIIVVFHRPDCEFIVEAVECCGKNRWRDRIGYFADAGSANAFARSKGIEFQVPVFTYGSYEY